MIKKPMQKVKRKYWYDATATAPGLTPAPGLTGFTKGLNPQTKDIRFNIHFLSAHHVPGILGYIKSSRL